MRIVPGKSASHYICHFITRQMQDQQPLKIFIVYAREDADALRELRVQFIPVARSERLEVWYDGEILPGQHWDKEIKTQLQSADIILLFISKYFFASEYIQNKELKEALARHEARKSVVVPVIVRPCVWQDAFDVSQFQALPAGAQPIFSSHWRDHDEAMVSVVEGIKKLIEKLRIDKAKASQNSNNQTGEDIKIKPLYPAQGTTIANLGWYARWKMEPKEPLVMSDLSIPMFGYIILPFVYGIFYLIRFFINEPQDVLEFQKDWIYKSVVLGTVFSFTFILDLLTKKKKLKFLESFQYVGIITWMILSIYVIFRVFSENYRGFYL